MSVQLFGIAQNYAVLQEALLPNLMWDTLGAGSDPLLQIYPLGYEDASTISYDQWEDPFGLTALRGLDAPPMIVTLPGLRTYQVAPGYYGNKTMIRESQITQMRQPGTPNEPVRMRELMNYYMNYFLGMAASRIRQTMADLLLTGTFTNTTTNATDGTSDGSQDHTYTIENYRTLSPANDGNTGPSWNLDPVNATPINDMLYWQNYLTLGTSTSFGRDSKLITQTSVINDLLKTTQIQQTYKDKYGASIMGPDGVAELISQGFSLPKIEVYDEGYQPTLADVQAQTLSTFTRFIPPGNLIWAGKRKDGQIPGGFKFTRNAAKVTDGFSGYPVTNVSSDIPNIGQGLVVNVFYNNRTPVSFDYEISFNACPVTYYWASTAGISYEVAA